jgi:hypothetical protein
MLLILESIMYVSIVGVPTMAIYTFIAGLICFYNCISGWLILSRYKSTEVSDDIRSKRKSLIQSNSLTKFSQGAFNLAFKSETASTIAHHDANIREQALGALQSRQYNDEGLTVRR